MHNYNKSVTNRLALRIRQSIEPRISRTNNVSTGTAYLWIWDMVYGYMDNMYKGGRYTYVDPTINLLFAVYVLYIKSKQRS